MTEQTNSQQQPGSTYGADREGFATQAALNSARALIAEAAAFDGVSPVSDQALLAVVQGQRELFTPPESIGILGQGEIDLVVHPRARGRGLGTAALTEMLEHADDGEGDELRAWAHGDNPAAHALLSRAGFHPVRLLYRMKLDPALLPSDNRKPLAVPVPPGFTLRTFSAVRSGDAAAWVNANAAAFAAHPEQGRITEADFALIREEPWFDPEDLFLLAFDSGADNRSDAERMSDAAHGTTPEQLAGFTWVKTLRTRDRAGHDTTECELYAVGVRPEQAGKGLGRLLLDVTLARMAEHRATKVTLYVDGDNTAAVGLYERAGFEVEQRSTQWLRSGV